MTTYSMAIQAAANVVVSGLACGAFSTLLGGRKIGNLTWVPSNMSFHHAVLLGAGSLLITEVMILISKYAQAKLKKIPDSLSLSLASLTSASLVTLMTKTPFQTSLMAVMVCLISTLAVRWLLTKKSVKFEFTPPPGWNQSKDPLPQGVRYRYKGPKTGGAHPWVALSTENFTGSLQDYVTALRKETLKIPNTYVTSLGLFSPSADQGFLLEGFCYVNDTLTRYHQLVIVKDSVAFTLATGAPHEEFANHSDSFNAVLRSLRLGDDRAPTSPQKITDLAKLRKTEEAKAPANIALLSQKRRKKTGYCHFIPPPGWVQSRSDPSRFKDGVSSATISVQTEEWPKGSLADYVAKIRKETQSDPYSECQDMGKFTIPFTEGHFLKVESKIREKTMLSQHLVILVEGYLHILTVEALKDEFEKHAKTFETTMNSFRHIWDLFIPVSWEKADEFVALQSQIVEQFNPDDWEPFIQKITNDFTEMGAYWQTLVLQETKEKLLIKGLL